MPQQNGQYKKTKSQLPRSNTQRRGRKRTGRNPTNNPNQQNTTGQKRQLWHQTENQWKTPKFYNRHRISSHRHAKQPETRQPKRYTPTERKIPGRDQERNQILGENLGKHLIKRRNHKTTDTHYTKE